MIHSKEKHDTNGCIEFSGCFPDKKINAIRRNKRWANVFEINSSSYQILVVIKTSSSKRALQLTRREAWCMPSWSLEDVSEREVQEGSTEILSRSAKLLTHALQKFRTATPSLYGRMKSIDSVNKRSIRPLSGSALFRSDSLNGRTSESESDSFLNPERNLHLS